MNSALKMEMWPIEKVTPYKRNSKLHDKAQVASIATSIERFGFDQPIVVDKDGVIIKGHGRRLACISLGLTQVPVLVRHDLTTEQANAARLADNRVAIGDFDTDLLKAELELIDIGDLKGIFDDKELEFLDFEMTEIKDEEFAEDLTAAVGAQEAKTSAQMDESAASRVPLIKVLGFKDVAGADQIHLNRFMAQAEATTGKQGADAFITFIKSVVSERTGNRAKVSQ